MRPIDPLPFEPGLAKWREFRTGYEQFAVAGMTVNERLNEFSLADDYERAVSSRDADAIRRILEAVYVDDLSINQILERTCPGRTT